MLIVFAFNKRINRHEHTQISSLFSLVLVHKATHMHTMAEQHV